MLGKNIMMTVQPYDNLNFQTWYAHQNMCN